ncbi:MAG: hypothetical protein KDK44_06605, partial [Chlamydiia bacterium]|nr:hypothetical protein [Chlamydiia bacterium]
IIDEVHMLTKEAFNALLKTLEEPPPRVKFFFATTEPSKIPPTILSRCQRFNLSRMSESSIVKNLSSITEDLSLPAENSALHLIAQLADGSMRDSQSLLDQVISYTSGPITLENTSQILGMTPKECFFALDSAVLNSNLAFAFELAETIFDSGKDLKHFLDSLITHYRFILRLHLGTTTNQEGYKRAMQIYTHHDCLAILDYLVKWVQQIPSSPFKRIDLEMVLLYILRIKKRLPLDALIARLSELEQKLGASQKDSPPAVAEHPVTPSPQPQFHPAPEKSTEPQLQTAPTTWPPEHTQETSPVTPPPAMQELPPTMPSTPQTAPVAPPPTMHQTPPAMPPSSQIAPVTPPPSMQELPPTMPSAPQTAPVAPPPSMHQTLPPPQIDRALQAPQLNSSIVQPNSEAPPASHYDTLLSFAAIELNGTIKK